MDDLFKLIKKYPKVSPDILKQYKEPDKFIMMNEGDPDLYPFKINLPDPPELHLIANFGKPAKDQKFTPPKLPDKLVRLQKKFQTIDEIWDELEKNQYHYREEIKFIENQWRYRLYGYWVFINGKPTYIDGWHYFYCAWWNIDIGLPKYRSRDWKFFHAARYCYTTTMAVYKFRVPYEGDYRYFSHKEKAAQWCKDAVIPYNLIEEGFYEKDMGKRTIIGFNYPKFRREGATFKAEDINYAMTSIAKNIQSGIQSMTDGDAKKVYLKAILNPWKKLPFFFKPKYEGSTAPQNKLSFTPPAIRMGNKGSLSNVEDGLESYIDFAIADGSGYDGQKLLFHHHDEVGKFVFPLDLVDISSTIAECLTLDKRQTITGLGIKTSTVGKMDEGQGGDKFRDLCEMSMWDERDDNGQTLTGFINIFIPSHDGIVVDEFGNSIIEDPPHRLNGERGNVIVHGGKTIINNTRAALLAAKKFEELAKEKRQFPETFAECFSTAGGVSRLPVGLIEMRLEELRFNNPTLHRGNFNWVDKFGGNVRFDFDPLGKWNISKILREGEANQRLYDGSRKSWVPRNKTKFTLGIDPFKHDQTKGSKRSKGGGFVKYHWDPLVDPSSDWTTWTESCRCVCTYANRTFDKEEFYTDMLMTAIYFGAGVYPEINISEIWTWFDRKGFGEYLIYKVDYATGKESITPGDTALLKHKEKMFTDISTQLIRHCHREVHTDWLVDCKKIAGPKDMTKFDLFAAGGWAEIGSQEYYPEDEREDVEKEDMGKFWKARRV